MTDQVLEWGHSGPAYVLEKFRKAVDAFRIGEGPLHERITQTYFYFQLIAEVDLPAPLQSAHREIARDFLRHPDSFSRVRASRIGDALHTIKNMSQDECMLVINKLATLIVMIEQAENRAADVRHMRFSAGTRFPSPSQKKVNG